MKRKDHVDGLRFGGLMLILTALCLSLVAVAPAQAEQQLPEFTDITIRNISNTLESSVDPVLLADKTGRVHLFWSEDVDGRVSLGGTTAGNTIMYASWDGVDWSSPVDILLTPSDGVEPVGGEHKAWQPAAVIDDRGMIHLIWLGQYPDKLYYSTAFAPLAGAASSWSTPMILAEDPTGSQYSIDIGYEAPNVLHLVYARVHWETQYADGQPRLLAYMKSTDGGETWSSPVNITIVPDLERGYSNVRLLVTPTGHLVASWTEWDLSGNGQAVYVARSLDSGNTWDAPVKLAEREPLDYERDWMKLAWLEGDRLVAVWEGGYRAYRHFMFSDDAGLTWSEPWDRFYWLIGDNGFPDFARDGAGNLHFFVAQRVREGSIGRPGELGLWHSVWLGGDNWTDAKLLGGGNDMVFISVVIAGGNNLVAAWYATLHGEVMVMNAKIKGVPEIAPQQWPQSVDDISAPDTPVTEGAALSLASSPDDGMLSQSGLLPEEVRQVNSTATVNVGSAILAGVLPVCLLILALIILRQRSVAL